MSSDTGQKRLPGRVGFTFAAVLGILAIVIGAVVAIVIGRALVGYSITPFDVSDPVTVTVKDRSVALWMTPETAGANCFAVNDETQEPSVDRSSDAMITVTDGGQTWSRLGLVEGPPGSTHTVSCTAFGNAAPPDQLGYAPNPQMRRYVLMGVGGGLVALLIGTAGIVLAVVTGVRRGRANRPAPA